MQWLRFDECFDQAARRKVRDQIAQLDTGTMAFVISQCRTLLSDDLQAGMNFAGVVVENPF